jgi:phospholipid/cholesterol/gamma-HCH transport system substrate-binding protein
MTRRALSMKQIGAVALAVLGVVTVVAFTGVFRKPFEPATRTVYADFERAAQLHKGDQVRLDGKIDGKVTGVEPAPRPEQARVKLSVNKSAGPIYADARARIRAKTLLGAAMYVEIDRGTPQAGPLGDRVIPTDRTSVQVEIDDVTDIFRAGAVTGLRTLPPQLTAALSDPKPLKSALRTVSDIAPTATTALDALRGRNPGTDLPDLVAATSKTVKALDAPDDKLRALVSGAAATVEVTGRRAAEIRETIRSGPGVTSDLDHTLARLDGTLDNVRGLVTRLEPAAPDIAPTLARLRPTLLVTNTLLDRLGPLVRVLKPTLVSLGGTGGKGANILDDLKPSLKRLDGKVLPYLGRPDPITGKSTIVMIGGTAAGFGGASGQQDGNGHFIRFPASVGLTSVYLPCRSNVVDPNAARVLACDSLQTALKNYAHYFPPGLTQTPGAGR